MIIREMTEKDIDGVLTVENESFSTPWTKRLFYDEVANPHTIYYVCCENDEIVAYGGMWHVADEGQITNIAVRRAARQRGIGSKILKSLISWAREREIAVIGLEVREKNENALSLYKKNGFEAVGRRRNYYKNPTEDAILMDLRLKNG